MIKWHTKKLHRWHKLPRNERYIAEEYLRAREKYCVSASARFLIMNEKHDYLWYIPGQGEAISALLLHSRQSLLPVLNKNKVPSPRFLYRFLVKVPIHAIQGLREDTEILETLMENQGYYADERIDYELMSLDKEPRTEAFNAGPKGLILRKPVAADEDSFFKLQAAYEQEEVLPKKAVFNPAACRLNMEHILSSERTLVAELNHQVVGKVNTSAESFTRYQIGGVYVRPDCRGMGIAAKMTAFFVRDLLAQGKGISLFVKRHNNAALKVYRRIGFVSLADYRISYY